MKKFFQCAWIGMVLLFLYAPILILAVYSFTESTMIGAIRGFSFQNYIKGAEAAGLPVTFHLTPFIGLYYGLVVQHGMPELEEVLQRFPNLKFFGHSQAFWAEMGANPTLQDRIGWPSGKIEEEGAVPRLMRKYPNLYGDLSAGSGFNAMNRDEEYAIKFLNEFQDRLFFGTDNCQPTGHMYCLKPLAEFLTRLRDSGKISESVFNKIARENAIRVLDL